jgi:hypothetical protein
MEYSLTVQRLSSGEHRVSAFPTTDTTDVLHHSYSSWDEFKSAFSKYIDEAEAEWLNKTLSESSFGVDVFKSRGLVTYAVLHDLGIK